MMAGKRKAPKTVEPLDPDILTARRSVILAKRRARKLAKPIYINTDASWRIGVAGLAYVSGPLGNRTELVACPGSTEGEYLALLMAMEDAERAEMPGPIDFRVNSTAVSHLSAATTPEFMELRSRINEMLSRHRDWRLAYVERQRNRSADRMARRVLKEWLE